jgi:hypothetical protein
MWFLGEPTNLIVSLNFANPGPVELDFDGLSTDQQKQILNSIQAGHIKTDVDFNELNRRWLRSNPPVKQETPQHNEALALNIEMAKRKEERLKKAEERKMREDAEREKMVKNLIDVSIRALKQGIAGNRDITFIRMLLAAEKVNQNRKGAIRLLQEKIEALLVAKQKEVDREVRRKSKETLMAGMALYKETTQFDVVDFDEETLVLTPEDLIREASKEPA